VCWFGAEGLRNEGKSGDCNAAAAVVVVGRRRHNDREMDLGTWGVVAGDTFEAVLDRVGKTCGLQRGMSELLEQDHFLERLRRYCEGV
jgi:hypothetical protein